MRKRMIQRTVRTDTVNTRLSMLEDSRDRQYAEIKMIVQHLGLEFKYQPDRTLRKPQSAFRRWWNYIIRKDRW
jgi:hypothetical protein